MDLQQMTIQLLQLVALLFPFLGVLLRMTTTEISEMDGTHPRFPVRDVVLVGGGFSIVFLIGSTILLVNILIRTSGFGIETPFGLALLFLLVSLVIFGIITVVFLWGVLVADTH